MNNRELENCFVFFLLFLSVIGKTVDGTRKAYGLDNPSTDITAPLWWFKTWKHGLLFFYF